MERKSERAKAEIDIVIAQFVENAVVRRPLSTTMSQSNPFINVKSRSPDMSGTTV